jgi:hypothetical protein
MDRKVNAGSYSRFPLVVSVYGKIRVFLYRTGFTSLVNMGRRIKKSLLFRFLLKRSTNNRTNFHHTYNENFKKQMIKIWLEDISKLEQLVRRDLTEWKN